MWKPLFVVGLLFPDKTQHMCTCTPISIKRAERNRKRTKNRRQVDSGGEEQSDFTLFDRLFLSFLWLCVCVCSLCVCVCACEVCVFLCMCLRACVRAHTCVHFPFGEVSLCLFKNVHNYSSVTACVRRRRSALVAERYDSGRG